MPDAPPIEACAAAAPRATMLVPSLPIDPSAPGARPSARAAWARARRPLLDLLHREHPRHLLTHDRIDVASGVGGARAQQVDATAALRIPLVDTEVLRRLQLRLGEHPPGRRLEVPPPDRPEPTLVGERRERDTPPLPRCADHVGVGHAGAAQEHLVERRVEVHLADGPRLDTGLVHRQREARDATVLRHVPVGAGQQQPQLGVVRAGAPQLLAVDHPLVTVAAGRRRETGEVAAAAGFAEQLAPSVLTR